MPLLCQIQPHLEEPLPCFNKTYHCQNILWLRMGATQPEVLLGRCSRHLFSANVVFYRWKAKCTVQRHSPITKWPWWVLFWFIIFPSRWFVLQLIAFCEPLQFKKVNYFRKGHLRLQWVLKLYCYKSEWIIVLLRPFWFQLKAILQNSGTASESAFLALKQLTMNLILLSKSMISTVCAVF